MRTTLTSCSDLGLLLCYNCLGLLLILVATRHVFLATPLYTSYYNRSNPILLCVLDS